MTPELSSPEFSSLAALTSHYAAESAALRHSFERSGDAVAAIRLRSSLVDTIVRNAWRLHGRDAADAALVAIGGYGRRQLFPCSDVDLLYLCADSQAEDALKDAIRNSSQALWDVGLHVSTSTRTLRECERLAPENLEFTLALLDRRYIAGDAAVFHKLAEAALPSLLQQEGNAIAQALDAAIAARHHRFGATIFHLEPNIKDAPGGLRDCNAVGWQLLLRQMIETRGWPTPAATELHSSSEMEAAFAFLAAVRCFLHYRAGREDNILNWVAQDAAAANSIGLDTAGSTDPAYWMRTYYRHARVVLRAAQAAVHPAAPAAGGMKQKLFRSGRKRPAPIPETGFAALHGVIDVSEPAAAIDPETILRLFAAMAIHGWKLGERAETVLADALPVLNLHMPEAPYVRAQLREILLGPHAADALRAMHALGVLEMLIPEFHGIDALVVRDAYHRYTVDEHTFVAIGNIHALTAATQEWEKRFAALLPEIDRLELLLLALLMHDTGKAIRGGDHTQHSVSLAESFFARLDLDSEERATALLLIREHLTISAALRRDIFDPETIRALAERLGSPMELRMLCLLTYADIRAVHPDALTPWKAENLWQLFIATSNYMDRSVDEQRYHAGSDPGLLQRIVAEAPSRADAVRSFLEGLPQRYLQTRLPEQIRSHIELASRLERDPVQITVRKARHLFELLLITPDRPLLFADVAGALSGLGMNIVKADAFANEAGVVVDTFLFADSFATLELNPSEFGRFTQCVLDVVAGRLPVDACMHRRRHALFAPVKVRVETDISFDNDSSSHSTVMQVVAQDGPGLLRAIAAVIAGHGCDIRVALIDTEGEMAIDVFYLTLRGGKLDAAVQVDLAVELRAGISALRQPAALAG